MWNWGDMREYLDNSDYLALIAPRLVVVETGKGDYTYARPFLYHQDSPFAADKQVARRARAAYSEVPENFVHYLHYDEHVYHIGGPGAAEPFVRTPTLIEPTPK